MNEKPEKKWLTPNGGLPTGNGWKKSDLVEYTRSDIAQARIDELEAELNEAETLLSELQAIARAALKEKTND